MTRVFAVLKLCVICLSVPYTSNALSSWLICSGAPLQVLCLCHAASLTTVGGAHNSPMSHSQWHHAIEEWVSPLQFTLDYNIARLGSFTSPGIDTR